MLQDSAVATTMATPISLCCQSGRVRKGFIHVQVSAWRQCLRGNQEQEVCLHTGDIRPPLCGRLNRCVDVRHPRSVPE